MIPTTDFFAYSSNKNDVSNVRTFLVSLPMKLALLFNTDTSNFKVVCLSTDMNLGISVELFDTAFKEAEENYLLLLGETNLSASSLHLIGCTGAGLQLKALRINELWREVVNSATQIFGGIIDWGNDVLKKLLKKFLAFLNSLLGSLQIAVPAVDLLKEFKDFIESYIDAE